MNPDSRRSVAIEIITLISKRGLFGTINSKEIEDIIDKHDPEQESAEGNNDG